MNKLNPIMYDLVKKIDDTKLAIDWLIEFLLVAECDAGTYKGSAKFGEPGIGLLLKDANMYYLRWEHDG